ncbi:uncharacterized protein LOC18445774 isoform X1 [Amborella trichopoda]|uniref:uncharacterized protein LOC18445774 isoform X1 n=1 Tax=Amborella trichopoda TaxID=13333 RepID=UPI0005D460AB|nr:uncharacterized protein LOC18445774 isoform X1 [Amborella trichopoda]XP_020530140.1 uncharacterized protein LOC18445774 isoform X1 [Amborella trichopoda]XP_020530141.1 uncharacterized protein LOC18445774 isoform X1 [Amborella trichopoda]|eukprot:XP_011627624.1 uncharacterized protein LOC18445774 isoform X1 [Amborella trichopoda]
MLALYASSPISLLQANDGRSTSVKIFNVRLVNYGLSNPMRFENVYCEFKHFGPPSVSNLRAKDSMRWRQHSWQVYASMDDEYRSSRNIAVSLFRRYRDVIERGGSDNLREFVNAGVNAYALGCTDEGLRKELTDMKNSGIEMEGLQSYGGSSNLKSKMFSKEIEECILWLSIIFITILCTPQPTVVRWSSTSPVSAETKLQWKGFCAIIANAYYMRGMAWFPVKTLQLEQMAVMGSAEEPSVVASRMRLVFSTLEVVSPQWPRV